MTRSGGLGGNALRAIRKDDPAKHLDKLKKSGDGATLRIVVPRENEATAKHHILIGKRQFLGRRSPCV
jgi:hypothetical protein